MKISEALILYFSVGAPLAVYIYFQTRAVKSNAKKIWRASIFTFLFWFPAAWQLFTKLFFSSKRTKTISQLIETDKKLHRLQKQFEKTLRSSDCRFSLFEFRETFDRYAGLTLISKTDINEANKTFFLAAQNKNPDLAAKCFNRRNRQRLSFHQTSARRDFLKILAQISEQTSEQKNLQTLACEFAEVLGDLEARQMIEAMFFSSKQTTENSSVSILSKDLWKPETQSR